MTIPTPPRAAEPTPPSVAPAMPEMGRYVFGVLRKGRRWMPGSSPALDSLQAAHLAHLTSMWEAGALVPGED